MDDVAISVAPDWRALTHTHTRERQITVAAYTHAWHVCILFMCVCVWLCASYVACIAKNGLTSKQRTRQKQVLGAVKSSFSLSYSLHSHWQAGQWRMAVLECYKRHIYIRGALRCNIQHAWPHTAQNEDEHSTKYASQKFSVYFLLSWMMLAAQCGKGMTHWPFWICPK